MSRTAPDGGRLVLGVTDPVSLILLTDFPRHLSDQGWDVHVVAGGTEPFSVPGATSHLVPMRRDIAPYDDVRSLVRWVRLLRRLKPSHVLIGTPKAGLLGIVAAWLSRVPRRTYHLRGLRLEGARGVTLALLWVLEWITCRLATDVLAVSPSLSQEAVRLRLAVSRKVHVLGPGSSNGVDVDHYIPSGPEERLAARDRLGIHPNAACLGFVGRITPDKGGDTLIEALRRLEPGVWEATLVVAGGVEDPDMRRRLEESAGQAGAEVTMLGHVTDLRPVYAAMDLLLLPSRREGMPNVVLEAASCGVPAIVSDATGARDSVTPDVTGWVFRTDDPDHLSGVLSDVLDADRLGGAGLRARAWMVEAFARDVVWSRIDTFLTDGPDRTASASQTRMTHPGRGVE